MQAELSRAMGDIERRTAAPSTRSGRSAFVYLGLGGLATLLYFFVPGSLQNHAFDVIGLTGVAAIVVGVKLNRPSNAMAWYAMALGQFLFVAGDLIWTYYEVVLHRESPFPSIADVAYLCGYVPLALGLLILVRTRRPGRNLTSVIDAAIITVAAGVGSWLFLMSPQIGTNVQILETGVSLAYPLADVMLLAVAASLVFAADTRAFSYRLIVASLVGLITADAAYTIATVGDWYTTGNLIDAGWLLSYVLWGAAALHPSMRKLTEAPPAVEATRFTRRRLATEAIAVLAIPAMWTIQTIRGAPRYSVVVVVGSTVASALVIARMGGLLSALESAALHDPLTGLPNRRLLIDRIGQAFRRSERSSSPIAVLFLDLGGFKSVNDRFGHDAGDVALIEIGRRIQSVVRASDTVARLGGDEFVVVCEGLDDVQAAALARRVRTGVSAPLKIGAEFVELTVDLGVAVENAPASSDVNALLVAADRAMYRAKQAAKETASGSPL